MKEKEPKFMQELHKIRERLSKRWQRLTDIELLNELNSHMLPKRPKPAIKKVDFKGNRMQIGLNDGRIISVPVKWFPGLARAKTKQRKQYIILPRGHGIHWPQLDEDLSLFGFLFPGGLLSFREMKRSS